MIIISKVEIAIEGVNITEDFQINEAIHEEFISNIECTRYGDDEIKVTAQIKSKNKNTNYLIYQDLKEYLLRLFVVFRVNVQINESKTSIDTDNNYYENVIINLHQNFK